jgi:peroxiredoxin (alkyl hydroperoxide reductase subunit C)
MKKRVLIFGLLLMTGSLINAQEKNVNSIPMIGTDAPAFTAETTNGLLHFPEDMGGQYWKILFSHPQDFTPVCTSEIMQLTRMQDEFEQYAVKIAIISADTKERHELWKKSIEEALHNDILPPLKINFPLIADNDLKVSRLYGMVHNAVSDKKDIRAVFIINPENKIAAIFYYPMNIGRNMDEIIRTVQALQTASASKLCTPVNWEPGGDLIIPRYPVTAEQMMKDPEILDDYYSVGSFLWFKKRLLPN